MSLHFSDRKRWASAKTKVEVLPQLSPYVPEEHAFDKPEDWRQTTPSQAKSYGVPKEKEQEINELRNAVLKKLREDSIALGKVHLDGIDEIHRQSRLIMDPKVRPNKPMKKDFKIGGLGVFGIGIAIFGLLVILRFIYIWKRSK